MSQNTDRVSGLPPLITEHTYQGFHYESRMVFSPAAQTAPIVMAGGAFQRKEGWGRLETGLLAGAHVLTLDLPGWGSADTLPAQYGVDFLVDALVRTLDQLALPVVNVAGGSYGSAIAYRLAQRRPDRVARMFLLGTMSTIPPAARARIEESLQLLRAGDQAGFAYQTVELFMCLDQGRPVRARAAIQRILLNRFMTATQDEIEKYLANTQRLLAQDLLDPDPAPQAPTLVATGEHDTFTTPERCRSMASLCTDAWFATVCEGDHMVHLERATEIADLMLTFYSGKPLEGLEYCRALEHVALPPPSAPREEAEGGQTRLAVQRTSDLTAAIRAEESERLDAYLRDSAAHLFQSTWAHEQLADAARLRAPVEPVIVRAVFGERCLADALDEGVRQVVGLGIGSDTRMWRLPVPADVAYYELDLPGQLDCKSSLLAQAGFSQPFRYVPLTADLRADWVTTLTGAGFDPAAPTCWIIEGISWYLSNQQISDLIAAVTSCSGEGSWMTLDVAHPAFHRTPQLQPFLDRMRALGSPFEGAVEEPQAWLAAFGWEASAFLFPELSSGVCAWLPPPPRRLHREIPLWFIRARKPYRSTTMV